jgi:hypothetical protein
VYPHGVKPEDLNKEVQAWIEAQMKEISPGYAGTVLQASRKR